MEKKKYTLNFLHGTQPFVVKELLEKYPDINIEKKSPDSLAFSPIESDIETFRNLYSPSHIKDENGKELNLSRRPWRKEYVPAGIDPSLAYIMCQIADMDNNTILYDPFCGAGTIPITALSYFNIKKSICSDISGTAIEKCKTNFELTDITEEKYIIFRSGIKDIKLNKQNVDRIITNLPFGIRVGSHEENVKIYKDLEDKADRLLRTKGQLIILTQEKKLIRDTFRKDKWNVESVARINEGGLLPEIFRIERK